MLKRNNVIFVLGAGKSQLPYLINLSKRGERIIAIDQDAEAPGFKYAEKSKVISTYDFEGNKKFVNQISPEYNITKVLTFCSGQPNINASKLSEELNIKDNSLTYLII